MIRGMLPDYRKGRGRVAYKKIRCYIGVPKEFEHSEKINFEKSSTEKRGANKFIRIEDI